MENERVGLPNVLVDHITSRWQELRQGLRIVPEEQDQSTKKTCATPPSCDSESTLGRSHGGHDWTSPHIKGLQRNSSGNGSTVQDGSHDTHHSGTYGRRTS